MKPLLRTLLVLPLALSFNPWQHARADDPSLRLGLGGVFTSWDMKMRAEATNGWWEDSDYVSGGLQLVFGYRPVRYLDLGLKAALTFPHRAEDDGLLAASVGETPTVFHLLASAKGVLPLPGVELYAGPLAGYSLFSGHAYTQDSTSHGLALGATLGMELNMTSNLALFVEAEYLHQFSSGLGNLAGTLSYDSLAVNAGLLFRL